jgi:hypothetical protein
MEIDCSLPVYRDMRRAAVDQTDVEDRAALPISSDYTHERS